jgi:hypothetical protein
VSDVFHEVEEEYRREQMAKFWAKYRTLIVGGAAVLIVGVASLQGWTYWRARQIESSSRALEATAQLSGTQGQEKKAAEEFAKIAANSSGGYPLMAKLQEAAMRAYTGDVKAAVALYDSIADGSGDALLTDFARLRAAILLVEREPYDAIKKRMEPLTSGTSPWKVEGTEILAYSAWRAGKKDEALKLYAEVQAAPEATGGTKRRALEMSALISAGMKLSDVKGAARPPAAPAEPLLLPPEPAEAAPGDPLDPAPAPSAPSPAPQTPTP